MRNFLLFLSLFILLLPISAQRFDTYFVNKTLRIDYAFAGNNSTQVVYLDQLNQLPQWGGRRNNLSQLLRQGNGQIKVFDMKSKACIYADSFSTLFQEWQTTPEAIVVNKSFENSLLVPYPKNKVSIEISLRNKEGLYDVIFEHVVDPDDILIQKKGFSRVTPYSVIHQSSSADKCINVVFVAEGYTSAEMDKFNEHARAAYSYIMDHSPFGKYKERFNFFAVETVSEDSGVSIPYDNKWLKTAMSSHFDTFYASRYLTTSRVKNLHDKLAGIPYAHIVILANTDVYGGGGIFNAYTLTTTGHADFRPVVVHEFGHSFGGLADEYYYDEDIFSNTYPLSVEPWEPNITTLVDFNSKWSKLLPDRTPVPTDKHMGNKFPVGVYEGAGYSSKGIYRSAIDCRMKTNSCEDFCPACRYAIEELVKFYTE